MSTAIIIRGIHPGDQLWLKREAAHRGISMEELVRRLIHEKREHAQVQATPSEAFRRYFGPEPGVELPLSACYNYRPGLRSDEG